MGCIVLWFVALASLSGFDVTNGTPHELNDPFYRGAVVDYNVISNSTNARENLMANVKKFETFIKQAATDYSDIIVFPEGGLLGSDRTIFLAIPNPSNKVVPATDSHWDEALQKLSSAAQNNKIYVVVNLHEKYIDSSTKETMNYNTNVVFDRNGTVISRYRKYHLFDEPLNITKQPEYATFDTDFNVTFGQFICFDILFKEPAYILVKEKGIKNFVYPTWWFSELPFLTAVQAQWSWAVGLNVNLLAAGINNIARGSDGSSIINGNRGFWGDSNYVFTNKPGDTLITSNILKDPSDYVPEFEPQPSKVSTLLDGSNTFSMLTQPNLNTFVSKDILLTNQTSVEFEETLCHSDLCCTFDLIVTYMIPLSDINYKAVAYSGDRHFGSSKINYAVQICGVYAFNSSNPDNLSQIIFVPTKSKVTFNKINISGNFQTLNSEILPSVLMGSGTTFSFLPTPTDVNFTVGKMSQLTWNPEKQIITAGILARVFRNAGNFAEASRLALTVPIVLVVFHSPKTYY